MGDVREVELWRVREPERPLRQGVTEEYIANLAASIKAHGLINPLTVRDRGGFFEVVAGHCRLLALRRCGVAVVRVEVREASDADVVVLGAHENLVRRDMSVAEEARLVAGLLAGEGGSVAGVARTLNRSEGWVRDRVDLLAWPPDVVGAICEGKLALGSAKALMAVEDEGERASLFGYAIANGCSVPLARRWAADANLGRLASAGGTVALSKETGLPGAVSARTRCFLCEVEAAFVDLIYIWAHRECVVALAESIKQAVAAEVAAGVQGGPGD